MLLGFVTLRPEVLAKGGGAVPRMFPLYFAYAIERMCNESIVQIDLFID